MEKLQKYIGTRFDNFIKNYKSNKWKMAQKYSIWKDKKRENALNKSEVDSALVDFFWKIFEFILWKC